jgi:hypothetical protein
MGQQYSRWAWLRRFGTSSSSLPQPNFKIKASKWANQSRRRLHCCFVNFSQEEQQWLITVEYIYPRARSRTKVWLAIESRWWAKKGARLTKTLAFWFVGWSLSRSKSFKKSKALDSLVWESNCWKGSRNLRSKESHLASWISIRVTNHVSSWSQLGQPLATVANLKPWKPIRQSLPVNSVTEFISLKLRTDHQRTQTDLISVYRS